MKKYIIALILIFTILISYSIIAQHVKTFRGNSRLQFPDKIKKLTLNPLPAGTYTVGTSGDFATIDAAFNRLSADGVTGPVTLELIDTLYQAPGYYLLNGPIPGAVPGSRITIQPAADKNITVTGYADAVLAFVNTSYLTIDGIGLSGNTTLTIHALFSNQAFSNRPVFFLDNSDHNIVQNITTITDDITRNSQGIGFWINNPQAGAGPDSNLIYHNFIKNAGCEGIYISGKNEVTEAGVIRATGNIVRGNIIGSETDGGVTWGIFTQYADGTVIENNIIQNVRRNFTADWINEVAGITCYWSDNSIIRCNIIHNVDNGSSYGSVGILLMGETSKYGNNWVYNNMVYDIRNSYEQPSGNASGIQMYWQNNPQIYYNTIYLSGDESSPSNSSALSITSQCSGVEAVDNIFANTKTDSAYLASAIYDYTDSNLSSDCNDLYCQQYQGNCLVRIGSTKYDSLKNWHAKGRDVNSISEMPAFMEGDLHIDISVPTNLASHGIPISGITTDFDGDLRDTDYSTDIGADEFSRINGVNDKVARPSAYTLEQNYPNPFNPVTTIKYSIPKQSYVTLKVYDIIGREVSTLVNEEKSGGVYQLNFYANNLASGVYFYCITVSSDGINAAKYTAVKKMLLMK